jgi:hypothetical protein
MDKSLKHTLRNVFTQCHRLLQQVIAEILKGQCRIYISGKAQDANHQNQ